MANNVRSLLDRLHEPSGRGPGDSGSGGGDNGDMETRIRDLEKGFSDVRERLARMEGRLAHTATGEDVAKLESTLLKWFIATAVAIGGLAFAAAKFMS